MRVCVDVSVILVILFYLFPALRTCKSLRGGGVFLMRATIFPFIHWFIHNPKRIHFTCRHSAVRVSVGLFLAWFAYIRFCMDLGEVIRSKSAQCHVVDNGVTPSLTQGLVWNDQFIHKLVTTSRGRSHGRSWYRLIGWLSLPVVHVGSVQPEIVVLSLVQPREHRHLQLKNRVLPLVDS